MKNSFIFTSPWVVTPSTLRHPAVVLLTASAEPLEVTAGDRVFRCEALAIAPLTQRGLFAMDVGLISFHVFPTHPSFAAFHDISAPGVLALERERFAEFDSALVRAYQGRLTLPEAEQLFDGVVDAAVGQLPREGRYKRRVDGLHELLRNNPACSLDELARELRLSYTGASHHFSRVVGLPLRSYQLWLKYYNAENLRYSAEDLRPHRGSLTNVAHAAGFSDTSHFARTWRASYGTSPTYTRDESRVCVLARGRAESLEY